MSSEKRLRAAHARFVRTDFHRYAAACICLDHVKDLYKTKEEREREMPKMLLPKNKQRGLKAWYVNGENIAAKEQQKYLAYLERKKQLYGRS